MIEELIDLLHSGGYSCAIANGDIIRTFTQRGVADLYDLLTQEPDFLKGALIADKVVGKGAAALMILGTPYRYNQLKGFGTVSGFRYKGQFNTGSTFYLESGPYRLVSGRNNVQ